MKFKFSLFMLLFFSVISVGYAYKPIPMVGGFDRGQFEKQVQKSNKSIKPVSMEQLYQQVREQDKHFFTKQEKEKMAKEEGGVSPEKAKAIQKEAEASYQKVMGKKPVTAQTTQPTQQPSSLTTCNCYDIHSPYTYASNFVYNQNNQRIYRKNPPCKCLPPPKQTSAVIPAKPTVINEPIEEPTQPTQPSQKKPTKPSSDWGITY